MTEGEFYLALLLLGFECNGTSYYLPSENLLLTQCRFSNGTVIRRLTLYGEHTSGSVCLSNNFDKIYNKILETLGIEHEHVEGADKSTNDLRLV
jgi:hypothetical protein